MLAIIGLAVATIAPALLAMTRRNSEGAVQEQEKNVYAAIFGDPVAGRFGFVGDIGRLPTSLSELVSRGSLPAFHTADGATSHIGKIGYGWNGPYLGGFFSNTDLVTDPWGQAFSYAGTGASGGQIVSGGADGTVGTGDDVKFPAYAPDTTGTLVVTVTVNGIGNPFGVGVKLYYPVDGEETVTPTQKFDPANPFDGFVFTNVTPGTRMLVITHTGPGGGGGGCLTVSRTVPVSVVARHNNAIEIRMTSQAQAAVSGSYPCTVPD